MAKNTMSGYTRWITPTPGDPTYSLLKAHLLFEELLRTYMAHTLPHASALDGARLTFAQVLAVARACSPHVNPDHWIWKAIGDLNRLRNMLSHESQPKAMRERMNEYISFVEAGLQFPLPESSITVGSAEAREEKGHLYSAVDVATFGLYYFTAVTLGFNVDEIDRDQEGRSEAMIQATSTTPLADDAPSSPPEG